MNFKIFIQSVKESDDDGGGDALIVCTHPLNIVQM